MTWSLGKNADPRVVLVLRALRGVAIGVKDGAAPEEREAWMGTFLSAGDEALARREFQDAVFRQPEERRRFRVRAYWAPIAVVSCSVGGYVMGQLVKHNDRILDKGSNVADMDALALTVFGVALGVVLAVVVLLSKFAVFASRPARDVATQKLLEERFGRINPARRTEAVRRVLSGGDPTQVAEEFGVALESLDSWGAVYLDSAQAALKQRFGAAS